jgi:hypothetical protein
MNTRRRLSLVLFLLLTGCSSNTPTSTPEAPAPALKDAKDVPASPGATIGIFRPSSSAFALALTFTPGFMHNTVKFGAEEDLPVAGDWDGNGFVKVGTFRPSDATFRLLNKNTTGDDPVSPAVTVQFGAKGDMPVAGDWDSNKSATIGVYRPDEATFYLRNSNTAGKPDITVAFGKKGDIPLAGDWDGNGSWTIGVYRPADSTFYLRNSNTSGTADITIPFGVAGDTPVVGDWDGNGTTTIGARHGISFLLRNANETGLPDITFNFASPDDKVVAGKWSRD